MHFSRRRKSQIHVTHPLILSLDDLIQIAGSRYIYVLSHRLLGQAPSSCPGCEQFFVNLLDIVTPTTLQIVKRPAEGPMGREVI